MGHKRRKGWACLGSGHLGCPVQVHLEVSRLVQNGSLTWPWSPARQSQGHETSHMGALPSPRLLAWAAQQTRQKLGPFSCSDLSPAAWLHGWSHGGLLLLSSSRRALRALVRPDHHSPTPLGAEGRSLFLNRNFKNSNNNNKQTLSSRRGFWQVWPHGSYPEKTDWPSYLTGWEKF